MSRVLTLWLFGESSAHNLVSSLPSDSSIWLFGESSSHIWLFGESSAHNLVSSPPFWFFWLIAPPPLLILLIALLPLLMILWLLLYWFLLYDCLTASPYWLFDWLMVIVLAALSTKITHFGCCFPLVLLTADLVYFSGLLCNKFKA